MTIEITEDGSATLRSAVHGETYHSSRGAVGEARHVFIEAGFKKAAMTTPSAVSAAPIYAVRQSLTPSARLLASLGKATPPPQEGNRLTRKILEMGFGTGLNAWLTLEEAQRTGQAVEYTAVELYPVPEEVAARLGYTGDGRFISLHRAPWGEWREIAEGFRLLKLNSDFADTEFSGSFDIVYWDAFAPDTQPELWTEEIFGRIFAAMAPGGVLVTYSAKGDVRRALQAAGFTVERLPGALGKRHMLRAEKS